MVDREGEPASFEDAVIAVLAATAPGDVLSYGEVAAEAGFPGAARAVGNLLARSDGTLPWWRVVTGSGRLIPHDPDHHARLLAAEGVECRNGRVVAAGAGRVRRRGGSRRPGEGGR